MLQSLQPGLSTFFSHLPQLLGALVVLVVGFLVAYILRKIITKLLNRFNLDDRLTQSQGGHYVERVSPQGSPALLVGKVPFWVIMLFVITSAIVTATYIAIISAAALASALAFGLGGRDAAAELINSGYNKA